MISNPQMKNGMPNYSIPKQTSIADDVVKFYEFFMLLAAPFVDTAEAIPRILSLHLQLAVEISYK